MHKKAPKKKKCNQTKAQNPNERTKIEMCLKTPKGKKVIYLLICVFVFFVRMRKRK